MKKARRKIWQKKEESKRISLAKKRFVPTTANTSPKNPIAPPKISIPDKRKK
jgi:hypothetical protein